jgi:hypothetical protein
MLLWLLLHLLLPMQQRPACGSGLRVKGLICVLCTAKKTLLCKKLPEHDGKMQ